MSRAKCDLHLHTTCSDGKVEPSRLVEMAKDLGLSTIAITDHDTFKAFKEAKPKADELDIDLIPGIEVTTSFKERECHLLGYNFDVENDEMNDLMINQRRIRKKRIKRITDKVAKMGIDVSYDEVSAEANSANLGRPHIAQVMVNKGYVTSISEAFIRYLSNDKLKEMKSDYLDLKDAIALLKNAGGAAILAHPGILYTTEEIEEIIKLGIDGLESIHPSHNYQLQKKYDEICDKNLLLKSGGSDFHGTDRDMRKHFGTVTISEKYVNKLKRLTEQRKALIGIA